MYGSGRKVNYLSQEARKVVVSEQATADTKNGEEGEGQTEGSERQAKVTEPWNKVLGQQMREGKTMAEAAQEWKEKKAE